MPVLAGAVQEQNETIQMLVSQAPGGIWTKIYAPCPVDYDTGEMGGVHMMEDEYQSIIFVKKSDLPENPDASKRNKHPKVSMLQDLTRASIKIEGKYFSGKVYGLNDFRATASKFRMKY